MWKIGKPIESLFAGATAATPSDEELVGTSLGLRSDAEGWEEAATIEEEEPSTMATMEELEVAAEPAATRLGTRCSAEGREEVATMEEMAAEPAKTGLGEVSGGSSS